MILFAYSIYDRKALQYHPPFYASTDASAARSFSDVANDVNTNIGRHPSDFVLYCVGTFNDQKATLTAIDPIKHVVDATALLPMQPRLPMEGA